jgi:hypothetical protein
MQFQHGTVTSNADGSLDLTPFAVDGRQLLSDPCGGTDNKGLATYTRYNQSETMKVCCFLLKNNVLLLMCCRNGKYMKTRTRN